jgi:DNA-binding NarL/FixJ family response regulator
MDSNRSGGTATTPHIFSAAKRDRRTATRTPAPFPTSIALIGGRTLQREALEHVLTASGRVCVRWTAPGLAENLDLVRRRPPDVLVLIPESAHDLLELPSLRAINPELRAVVVGVGDCPQLVARCAQNGVVAYLPADVSTAQLLDTIDRVLDGEVICPQQVLKTLFRYLAQQAAHEPPPVAEVDELTRREHDVLRLMAQGLSNKQIAHDLSIEVATVKSHVHRILAKLNLERRSQVVARLRVEHPRRARAQLVR